MIKDVMTLTGNGLNVIFQRKLFLMTDLVVNQIQLPEK